MNQETIKTELQGLTDGEPPDGGGEDGGAALFLAGMILAYGTVFARSKNIPKK